MAELTRSVDDTAVAVSDGLRVLADDGRFCSDTATSTDLARRTAAAGKFYSDYVGAFDSTGRSTSTSRRLTDTAAAPADLARRTATAGRGKADVVALLDSIGSEAGRGKSDIVATSDVAARATDTSRGGDDVAAAPDAAAGSLASDRSASDTAAATDAANRVRTLGASGSDSLAVAESTVRATDTSRAIADVRSLTETATATAETINVLAADTITTITDEATRLRFAHINPSFEDASANQGQAAYWNVASAGYGESVAVFGATLPTSWWPWEGAESGWRLPYLVHFAADTDNVIVQANAIVGNWASQRDLAGAVLMSYLEHAALSEPTHLAPDVVDVIQYYDFDLPLPNLATAITLANIIKHLLYDDTDPLAPTGHLVETPAQAHRPRVHMREDVPNRPSVADASDETTLVALLNHLKTKLNLHYATLGYGSYNESGLFVFANADLDPGMVQDHAFENFERLWAIPDILPNVWQYPVLPAPVDTHRFPYERQLDMVAMDNGIGGGGGWGFPADPARPSMPLTWGEVKWGARQTTSWPTGHEQLVSDLADLAIELGPPGGETFDKGWMMPGTSTDWYNDHFIAWFWDATAKTWQFPSIRLKQGIVDDFESDWKDNAAGLAEHWDGAEWRFWPTQIVAGGVNPYNFTTGAVSNPALVLPQCSPVIQVRLLVDFAASASFSASFTESNSDVHNIYFFLDAEAKAGTVISKVALTNSSTATRYGFASQFYYGALAVGEHTPSTSIVFEGWTDVVETFSTDWTLTLEI